MEKNKQVDAVENVKNFRFSLKKSFVKKKSKKGCLNIYLIFFKTSNVEYGFVLEREIRMIKFKTEKQCMQIQKNSTSMQLIDVLSMW